MTTTLVAVGEVKSSNKCGDYRVLDIINSRKVLIEFIETGHKKYARASDLKLGEVSDPLCKIVAGVGYCGVGPHKTADGRKHTRSYAIWKAMIGRCYGETYQCYDKYGAKGVRVCEEWHNFQNFASWFDENYVEGYHLDKDIVCRGSKLYSPETCRFVPQRINKLLLRGRTKDNDYALGVSRNKNRKFSSLIHKGSEGYVKLGTFDSMHQAFVTYKDAKERYIKQVAEEEYSKGTICRDVRDALCSWEIYPY